MTDSPATSPSLDAEATYRRDRSTWLFYATLCYYAYLISCLGPAMPFLRDELGFPLGVASWHFGAAAAGGVCVGLFGEPVIRLLGRERAHWLGAAGLVVATLLLTLGRQPVVTVAGALLSGLLGGLVLVSGQAALADHHGARRAIALTESNVLASGASILAAVAVGVFGGSAIGWRGAYWLTIPAILAIAWRFGSAWPAGEAAPRQRPGGRVALPQVFWLFVGVLVCGTAVEWCVSYWGAGFLAGAHGLSPSSAAIGMSVFFVGMLVGRAVGTVLARTTSPARLLPGALGLALVGFPLLWLAPTAPLALLGLGLTGLGIANVYPMAISAAAGLVPENADLALTRVAIGSSGSILLAPLVLGILADRFGIAGAFGIGVPLLVVGLSVALAASRRTTRPVAPGT